MESLLLLAKDAGLANILHQKRNALKYGAATPPLTTEEEEIAREYNSADVELYAYACRLFDERVREQGAEFQKRLKEARFLNEKYQKISSLLYERVNKDADAAIELSKDVRW